MLWKSTSVVICDEIYYNHNTITERRSPFEVYSHRYELRGVFRKS